MMDEDTYALGRIALLPEAGTPIQTDVKSAKMVMNMTAAWLKLMAVLQCIDGLDWVVRGGNGKLEFRQRSTR